MRLLVTGGAGFVGSTIARHLKAAFPEARVVALDNLKRRGSELTLPLLSQNNIEFLHGDIRMPSDFPEGAFDFLIECSAEPSVLAGYGGSPDYLIQSNLDGAIHCLNFCRRQNAKLIFLSTSRVYSVAELCKLPVRETASRFEVDASYSTKGFSCSGINEQFPTTGPRSLYGTTKLAAELFIEEYREAYGLEALILRCGVLTGPWQMARADQGIFCFWLLKHLLNQPLKYIGFNGSGKQVRDLLHCEDLARLIRIQVGEFQRWAGRTINVGGTVNSSLSLLETTKLCQELTGNSVPIQATAEQRPMDIPYFVMDNSSLYSLTAWRPTLSPKEILADIHNWLIKHQNPVRTAVSL
jgi:CDP-paratose 2-epimerase